MDLTKFEFPEVTQADLAFPTFGTIPELLAEAKERGFYESSTPYNELFNELFYNGGEVIFKKGIDSEFRKTAWPYCKVLMGSFAPKHEEKEAVCAMLMSEILEVKGGKEKEGL